MLQIAGGILLALFLLWLGATILNGIASVINDWQDRARSRKIRSKQEADERDRALRWAEGKPTMFDITLAVGRISKGKLSIRTMGPKLFAIQKEKGSLSLADVEGECDAALHAEAEAQTVTR